MNSHEDNAFALIELAAALRAEGQTWDAIGQAVDRHADTVRRWPERHPHHWDPTYRAVESQVIADAANEARTRVPGRTGVGRQQRRANRLGRGQKSSRQLVFRPEGPFRSAQAEGLGNKNRWSADPERVVLLERAGNAAPAHAAPEAPERDEG